MIEHALSYAARGWPVFPCDPETKRPLVPNGFKVASLEPGRISEWWGRWPDALIGAPTGHKPGGNGCLVIDIDPKEGLLTEDIVAEIAGVVGDLPPCPMVRTPRGGLHLWYGMPDNAEIGNRAGVIPHVDVRGTGGYVILPPSVRRGEKARAEGCDGVSYVWEEDHSPDEMDIPEATPEIIDFVTTRHERRTCQSPRPERGGPEGGIDGRGGGDDADGGFRPVSDAREAAIRKFALSAFDAEIRNVAMAPSGTRNQALNNAALALGSLCGAGALADSMVRAALENAARESGLLKEDGVRSVRATIESGMSAGLANPRDLSAVGRKAGRGGVGYGAVSPTPGHVESENCPPPDTYNPGGGGSDWPGYPDGVKGEDQRRAFDIDLARLPLTDLGNARRFLARFGDDFRWCKELGWLAWDGRRWRVEGEDKYSVLLLGAAIRTVEMIKDEARALEESRADDDLLLDPATFRGQPRGARWGEDVYIEWKAGVAVFLSDLVRRWAKSSQSAGKITAFAPLARQHLKIERDRLDGDPWSLTVMNGTLKIKHGEALEEARKIGAPYITLEPHKRDDLSTHLAPVNYDPDATCPGYDRFFEKVQPDPDMRRALHQWAGMSGTGNTGTRAFVWHYGPQGSNGKSTWANAIRAVYGDYALQIKIETILNQGRNRRGGEATPDLAELPGVRAIFCSEPESGAEISESLIKDLTGGDPVTCRTLYGPMFRFEMEGKLSVNGNHEPRLRSTDDAIWGRLKIVPWLVSIPEGDPERKPAEYFNALWREEGSGILNRLLDGLRDWLDHGLTFPDAVAQATAEHRADSDVVGTFAEQCIQRVPPEYGCRVQSTRMHQLYCAWARANGHRENSQKWLKEKMEEKGFSQIKSSVVFWQDVHLLYAPDTFVGSDGEVIQHASPPVPRYFEADGREVPPTREGG